MIENIPIVAIAIGYIIGIILGLYCKISIAFLYTIFCIFYAIYLKFKKLDNKFKLISFRRYSRYIKMIFTKKVFTIILISALISNTITLCKNNEYKKVYQILDTQQIKSQATVISNPINKKYSKIYKVKIKNKKFYLNIKNVDLNYGDIITIDGIYKKPSQRRNFGGFDYSCYLKTLGVYGTIDGKNIKKIGTHESITKVFNNIFLKIKNIAENNFQKEFSSIILGITLGYTEEIEEDVRNNFSESNISHVLAVSGMHIGYVVLACTFVFNKIFGKRKGYFLSILFCLFYMALSGMSPSVVRATIMTILALLAKLIYKKSDIWTNISISSLILLIYNPYLIQNVGFVLSFAGTIGILIYSKNFQGKNKIKELIGITVLVSIINAPLVAIYFNKIPVTSLIIGAIIGFIVAPIIILFFLYLIFNKIVGIFQMFYFLVAQKIIYKLLEMFVKVLINLAKIGSNLPLSKVYIITPKMYAVIIYYVMIFTIMLLNLANKPKNKNYSFYRRVRNLKHLFKFRLNQNKRKIISIFLILAILISITKIIPKNIKIHFIDVGQGDSCLISTPSNKRILIDGGGSENYDVGKNTLVPYLLDRGIIKIDYIIISHFDTDHVRTAF